LDNKLYTTKRMEEMESNLLAAEELIDLLPQIRDLYKLSFNQDMSEEYFKWRYLENPTNDLIVSVVLDKQKLIHARASIPTMMQLNGMKEKTISTTNVMVHPEYRDQGLLSNAQFFYEEVIKRGYKLVWGFPNNITHRIAIRAFGFSDVYEIPTMQLDLGSRERASIPECETDHQFNLDYSDIYTNSKLNCVVKNEAYLSWRYYKNPSDNYYNFVVQQNKKVSSYMVVKRFRNRLNIIDLQVSNPEEGSYLLDTAINYALSVSLDMVTAWLPRHAIVHSLAEKRGFRNSVPITYFCILPLTGELDISTNYGDWFIQMGDFYSY